MRDDYKGSFSSEKPCRAGDCSAQPWRCLCFGFSQMTMTLPLRLMILHFSHMGFTEGLTFICYTSCCYFYPPAKSCFTGDDSRLPRFA